MIREILKMLNQYAVDHPIFPVNGRYSHFFAILAACWAVLWECWAAAISRQTLGTRMENRETFLYIHQRLLHHFFLPGLGFQSMDFQRVGTHITACNEWTPNTRHSEMPVMNVSPKFIRQKWGNIFKELWGWPTTTASFGSSFWQMPNTSNICLLEDKIHDWGMCLFTISYGSYVCGSEKWRWLNQWMISNLRVLSEELTDQTLR